MANVVIKSAVQAYNIDTLNRTAVCASDLENGSVFTLDGYSTVDGEDMVWTATAPADATAKGLWMATSPEVVITRNPDGTEYKGLTPDPRAFINYAGKMIDATKLMVSDIVEMTADGIADIATSDYLVPEAGEFKLVASTTAGTGFCLKKIGTSRLHIGQAGIAKASVPTYKFEVVLN